MKLFPQISERILLGSAAGVWLLRWPFLQLAAWSKMLVNYSSAYGLHEGFRMTFSGDYPCSTCLAIRHGVSVEKAWITNAIESPLLFVILSAGLLGVSFALFTLRKHKAHHVSA